MSDLQALTDLYAATDSDALQARPDMVLGPCHFIYKSVDDLFKEGLTDPNKMQNAYDLSAKILEDTMPMRHGSSEGPISCRPVLETAYMYNQYAKILFKRGDLTGAARNTKFAGGILAGSTDEIRKVAERLTLDILQDCHNRLEAIKKLGSGERAPRFPLLDLFHIC